MADRRPLVSISGRTKMLPVGDTVAWAWLSGVPANLTSWAAIAPSSKADTSALAAYVPLIGANMTGQLFQNTTYSLYGYGGNGGSEQGFIGGWGNTGIWRQWPSATDHSQFTEALLSYSGGLKVDHSVNGRIFDLSASGNLRVPQVSIGGDTDILLYEGAANQLNIRVGSSAGYRYWGFNADGSFGSSGISIKSGGSGNPGLAYGGAVLNIDGTWGGGIRMLDGGVNAGIWMQSDATLRFGVSASTGALTEMLRLNPTHAYVFGKFDASDIISSRGSNAMLAFDQRDAPGDANAWGWYASDGSARLWKAGIGDRLSVQDNGDIIAAAALFPGGAGTCYLFRIASDRLGINQHLSVHGDLNLGGTAYNSNWWRSYGNTGWFNETYGGGIYISDTTWIRTYGGKGFLCDNTVQGNRIEATLGGLHILSANSAAWIRVPRTFVQSSDPGAHASDGDLWFW